MKRVWLTVLIGILILSLIACSNVKDKKIEQSSKNEGDFTISNVDISNKHTTEDSEVSNAQEKDEEIEKLSNNKNESVKNNQSSNDKGKQESNDTSNDGTASSSSNDKKNAEVKEDDSISNNELSTNEKKECVHQFEKINEIELLCTQDGYTGDDRCVYCGEIVKNGDVLKATGHDYIEGKCKVCRTEDPDYRAAKMNITYLGGYIGLSYQLSYTILPAKTQSTKGIWSSSNEAVVQVSESGLVTGVGKGSAVIKVVTEEGLIATCDVQLEEVPLAAEISISDMWVIQTSTGYYDAVKVTAVISGGSGDYVKYNIKLYCNDQLIDEGDSDTLLTRKYSAGTYRAEVYVKDSRGNEKTFTMTKKLQ